MQEIANAPFSTDIDLANTRWKLAGYHEMMSTIDGKGQIITLIPTGVFAVRFGAIDQDTCPVGFYCATVIRKHVDLELNTSCGSQEFRSYFSQIYNGTG